MMRSYPRAAKCLLFTAALCASSGLEAQPGAPTVTISPEAAEFLPGTVVNVTVRFCDNAGFNLATRVLTVNNVSVNWPMEWDSPTGGAPGACYTRLTQSGQITVGATIRASIEDNQGNFSRLRSATYAEIQPWRAVKVVADNQYLSSSPSAAATQRFVVHNLGPDAQSVTFAAVNSGLASVGAPSPASFVIPAFGSTTVQVATTARSQVDSSGRVWLRATLSSHRDSAFTEVLTVATPSLTNGVQLLNPTGVLDRSDCITLAVGPSMAAQCGDLQVAHALPSVRTRTRLREPVLLYSSAAAEPRPHIAVDLTILSPVGGETYSAVVRITGGAFTGLDFSAGSWSAADFAGGGRRRIVATFDADTLPTGRYPYELRITRSSGPVYVAAGELLIVNRLGSALGAGWWIAGVESLAMDTDTSTNALWIGGDGSLRVFRRTPGTCTWVGDPHAQPDTILAVPSGSLCSQHTRLAPNRTRVEFDASRRHSRTINRLADTTLFVYGTGGRLESIHVPSRSLARSYVFQYDGSGALSSIAAPEVAPFPARVVQVTNVAGPVVSGTARRRISRIAFPDSAHAVVFEYAGAPAAPGTGDYRISGRRDRMGVLTSISYGASGRVTQSSTPANATETIVNALRVAEAQGVGIGSPQALLADSVYTRLDGPRSDVSDVTKWWINSRGAVVRLRTPSGEETRLAYSAAFPGLPTTVADAAGMTTKMFYNARGLADSVVAIAPLGGQNAATRFIWHPSWDLPTKTTDPNGVETNATYDLSTGNILTRRVGGDANWNVEYTYDATGMLREVLEPLHSQPQRVAYDTIVGNLTRTQTPLGAITKVYVDRAGRDTLIVSQTDIASDSVAKVTRSLTVYDSVGRIKYTRATHPAMPYSLTVAPADTMPVDSTRLTTAFTYDRENRVLTVAVSVWPTPLPPLVCPDTTPPRECPGQPGSPGAFDQRSYDLAGRQLTQRLGMGARGQKYDLAGNIVRDSMATGEFVHYSYDESNRLVRRIVPAITRSASTCAYFAPGQLNSGGDCWMQFPLFPNEPNGNYVIRADTSRFVFDYAGRMVRADNADARIARTYFPNGQLRTDSTRLRSYSYESFPTAFGLSFAYDVGGRRSDLTLPASLGDPLIAYGYDSSRGYLSQVTQGQNRARFNLDSAGRQDSVIIGRVVSNSFVPGLREVRRYDEDDRQVSRVRQRVTGAPILSDSMTYDVRGRIRDVFASSPVLDIGTYTQRTRYAGNGSVLATEATKGGAWWEAEQFRTAADGSVYYSRADKGATPTPYPQLSYYSAGGSIRARRPLRSDPSDTLTFDDTLYNVMDLSGNITHAGTRSRFEGFDTYTAQRNFYRADHRLAATQRYVSTSAGRTGAWEEYRYDALGRRVLTRVRRQGGTAFTMLCSIDCVDVIERTLWDGDAILYELRNNGGDSPGGSALDVPVGTGSHIGKAGYVNAGGIDAPIFLMSGRVPNYNWRGLAESSSQTDGAPADCALGPGANCTNIAWPAQLSVYYKALPWAPATPPNQWIGNVVKGGAGAAGSMYRRNRYYDPVSGQFTQPDPIGLAGGLNLYGYANGDPINGSDPFGLKVIFNGAEAQAFWNQLVSEARAAERSKDRSERSAGRALSRMLQGMWDDPDRVYSVNVVDMSKEEFDGTGGADERTHPDLRMGSATLSIIQLDPRALAGPLTALSHELGGARSRQFGGPHNGPGVSAENLARTIFGCQPPRSSHDQRPTYCR